MRPRIFLVMLLGDRQEPETALMPVTHGCGTVVSREATEQAGYNRGHGRGEFPKHEAGRRNQTPKRTTQESMITTSNSNNEVQGRTKLTYRLTHRDISYLWRWLLVMPDGGRKAGMRVFIQFCFWTLMLPIFLRTLPGNPLTGQLRIPRSTGWYGSFKSPSRGKERTASAWSRLFVPSL